MASLSSGHMLPRLQLVHEKVLSSSERTFIHKAASDSGIRLDGRGVFEPRLCEVRVRTVGKARSLAQCVLGGSTKVSCCVSAELSLPYPDRPNEGILLIQSDYMHSAGTRATAGIDLQLLERSIQKAVDVESLCVVPGRRVWLVACHIVIIDDCGSILDACSIATSAALLHFRRPELTIVGEEITVHSIEDRVPVPLSIHYTPLVITFALIEGKATIKDTAEGESREGTSSWLALVDPTDKEEQVAEDGSLQVVLNAHKEVCGMSESGPLLSKDEFSQLLEIAGEIRQERGAILDQSVLSTPFI